MNNISDMLRDALYYLTESEMNEGLRAKQLRAEAMHHLTGALKEVIMVENALAKIIHEQGEARYEGTD
jgi:Arc/MetJ-type ribon-helix-helix transcriptional regulator